MITDVAIYTSSSVIASIFGFILTPILTNYISPEEYANIGIYMSIIQIGSPVFGAILNTYVSMRFHSSSNSSLINNVVHLFIFYVFAGTVCLTIFYLIFPSFYDLIFILLLLMGLISYSGTAITLTFLQMSGFATKWAIVFLLNVFAGFILTIFSVVKFDLGYWGRIYSIAFSQLFAFLLSIFYIKKYIPVFIFNRYHFKYELLSTFPLIISAFFSMGLLHLDRFVFKYYNLNEGLGLYVVLISLMSPLVLVQTIFCRVWTPYAYRILHLNLRFRLLSQIALSIFIFLLISIFFSLISPVIYKNFIGVDYSAVYNYFWLSSLVIFFQFPYFIMSPIILQYMGAGFVSRVMAYAFVINLILNFFLIKYYDIYAALFSLLIVNMLITFIYLFKTFNYVRSKFTL